jgi:hypothetical protein
MKRIFTLLFTAVILLSSCEKNNETLLQNSNTASTQNNQSTTLAGRVEEDQCPQTSTQLIAGQHFNSGSVTVTNDANSIYVTYNTANGYLLKQTHLFAGNCNAVPTNNQGNPVPGQFPYKAVHINLTNYTYQIPIASIPAGSCACIAAHAVVVKLNNAGQVIEQQTAWGNGVRINPNGGNWGMKFDYCSCIL